MQTLRLRPRRAPILALSLVLAQLGVAHAEPPSAGDPARLLDEAYRRKAAHDEAGAAAAFDAARAAGADAQLVHMELGYLALSRGDIEVGRRHFEAAARGPDPARARLAKAEIRLLPSRFWADLYVDAYGWKRFRGAEKTANLVPTLRARAFVRPILSFDLDLYAFLQVTRDVASRGRGAGGLPAVYADDYALTGVGVMVRVFRRRLGFFLQAGPALNLLDDGKRRVTIDVRGGAFFGAEAAGCAPKPGVGWTLVPCAEVYAEAVYVSRFDHNIIAFARPRAALSYLVTGPVAFQVFVEGRLAKDRNDDFYNNLVDAGAGQRFRLLSPLRLDLLAGIHAGTYLGLASRDPAPNPLGYVDFRLQAATTVEF